KDSVLVEYLAAIRQQTGEDWSNVNITLSTAQPMLNAAPPELHALTMNVIHTPAGRPGSGGGQGQAGGSFAMKSQLSFGINPAQPGQPGSMAMEKQEKAAGANFAASGQFSDNIDALNQARGNRSK